MQTTSQAQSAVATHVDTLGVQARDVVGCLNPSRLTCCSFGRRSRPCTRNRQRGKRPGHPIARAVLRHVPKRVPTLDKGTHTLLLITLMLLPNGRGCRAARLPVGPFLRLIGSWRRGRMLTCGPLGRPLPNVTRVKRRFGADLASASRTPLPTFVTSKTSFFFLFRFHTPRFCDELAADTTSTPARLVVFVNLFDLATVSRCLMHRVQYQFRVISPVAPHLQGTICP